MQRNRHNDSLQGFLNSFKQFEKKLDKLQSDVSFHGKTLDDLRALVAKLSLANRQENPTTSQKRTISSQCETVPIRRAAMAVRPMKAKSLQGRYDKPPLLPSYLQAKKGSLPAVTTKNYPRPKKAQAPRKATTLRQQKPLEQKRRNPTTKK
ncbi:hypothetical protein O0L34_g7953 [Tuta absoluta]|nr:hypothetical protein O0L34_g7953 [Tuta absoluta]